MADLLGPQTLPELSLSVPRLGPSGGGGGSMASARSIAALVARPAVPAFAQQVSMVPSPAAPALTNPVSTVPSASSSGTAPPEPHRGGGATDPLPAAASVLNESLAGLPLDLGEAHQGHFHATMPATALSEAAHAVAMPLQSVSPPEKALQAATARANGPSASPPQQPNPMCLDDVGHSALEVFATGVRSGLANGLTSPAAAAGAGTSSFLTASELAAARREDRERQVAQSVQDFPAMLRGGGRASSATRNRQRFGVQRPSPQRHRMQQPTRSSSTGRISARRSPSLRGSIPPGVASGGALPSRSPALRSPPRSLGSMRGAGADAWQGQGSGDSPPPWRPPGQAARDGSGRVSRGTSAERANVAERRSLAHAAAAAAVDQTLEELASNGGGTPVAGMGAWARQLGSNKGVPTAAAAALSRLPPSLTPRSSAELRTGGPSFGAASGEWHRQASTGTAPSTCGTPSSSFRQDRGNWPLLREGFEPLGPMLRSLEFQVGALFELMDAHTSRDVSDCGTVTEVIDRKRESLAETFEAVKEALWWQQRKQRQSRHRSAGSSRLTRDASESPCRTPGSMAQHVQEHAAALMHDASSSSLGLSTNGVTSAPTASNFPVAEQPAGAVGGAGPVGGLHELEALRQQLARRVAAVVEDGGFSEYSAISSRSTAAAPATAPSVHQPDAASNGGFGVLQQAPPASIGCGGSVQGPGASAVASAAPVAGMPAWPNATWPAAPAPGIQDPLLSTTALPAMTTGALPPWMLAAPAAPCPPLTSVPPPLSSGWPLAADSLGIDPSAMSRLGSGAVTPNGSSYDVQSLGAALSPELAGFSTTVPAQATPHSARAMMLQELAQSGGIPGFPAIGMQASIAQPVWPFANRMALDPMAAGAKLPAQHGPEAAALASMGMQAAADLRAVNAYSAERLAVAAAAASAATAGNLQSAAMPGFAPLPQEAASLAATSPSRTAATPSTAEKQGLQAAGAQQGLQCQTGAPAMAATACPVGEPLQATALSPLVLTPTVFHYRSQD